MDAATRDRLNLEEERTRESQKIPNQPGLRITRNQSVTMEVNNRSEIVQY